MLGRRHRLPDVLREYADLEATGQGWDVETSTDVAQWVGESRQLAEFACHPAILRAVRQPGDLPAIDLPQEYLQTAGESARRRVIAAGVRLAALLNAAHSSD